NSVCYHFMDSNGRQEDFNVFITNESIAPSNVTSSIDQNDLIRLNVDADAFDSNGLEIKEFLLQFSLSDTTKECVTWQTMLVGNVTSPDISLTSFDSLSFSTEFRRVGNANIIRKAIENSILSDVCGLESEQELITIDTFLSCQEDWLIELPNGYRWEDNVRTNPRVLEFTGNYRAKNTQNCNQVSIIEYQLEKAFCDCEVYLPTAFSPNGDSINETLKFETNCNLIDFKMTVFNRWGNVVFESKNQELAWDGNSNKEMAHMGVYIVQIEYEWQDEKGISYKQNLVQEVNLLR
ncbi:MAG: gliding motility-associated C-terminal domain-containing protein, partial [Bacteroidota bacterium]